MTIGERIKERRIELGYTQDELAKKCGYKSRSSINKIELSRTLPLPKVSLMAKALECSESYLMGWTAEGFTFSPATKFENVLKYSNENHIPLSDLMGGRNIQPCDYEGIKNIRVHEVMKNYDIRTEQLPPDPDVRRIERASRKMPEDDKKFMMDMLERSFSEYFEDDGSDDPD